MALEEARREVRELERRLAESEAIVRAVLGGAWRGPLAPEASEASEATRVATESLADPSAVIRQLPCGVIVYDSEAQLLFANRAATEIYEPRLDPRLLPLVSLALAPSDPTSYRPYTLAELPVPRALSGEPVEAFECVVDGPAENELRALRLSAVPQVDAGGRVVGAICTVTDVSERVRLERELVQADRLACVGNLAAGMAHEINNPLAYILANVGFVAEELPALMRSLPGGGAVASPQMQEIGRALGDVREGAERIRRVVQELKSFARADGDLRQPTDVRVPLEAACQLAEKEIRHRARLVKELGAVPAVFANEERLRQLFVNLLMNAVQAVDDAPASVGAKEVRVRTRTGVDGEVIVEVEDTGPGIAATLLPRVFDPFFALRPSTTSANVAGATTGFGLATCESIALAHGGAIRVSSEVGLGTTFIVTLPADRSSVAPEASVSSVQTLRTPRGRLLVVDDELSVADSIRRILGRDHDVTLALRAADALEALAGGAEFDLILCDVMMPEMGGLEFYGKVSETRPELLPNLVFMTGGAFTPRARAFLASVPNARLQKPFSLADLRAFVATHLAR